MPVVNYDWDELEDNIVEEYDDGGTTIADYTTEPDHFGNVISQHRSGQTSFFHYDGQGSTLAVTDDSQNVTDTRAYSAFGEVTERTGTTEIPFQYIGQKGYYRDGIAGDYLIRTRPYQPARARWACVDPLGNGLEEPIGYVYVKNSPVVAFDPSGRLTQEPAPVPSPLQSEIVPGQGICVFTPVFTTLIRPCGGYVWPTAWKPGTDETDGLIIQKVCVKASIRPCKTQGFACKVDWGDLRPDKPCSNRNAGPCAGDRFPDSANFCYVEIWRVRAGSVSGTRPFVENVGDIKADPVDVFAWLGCQAPCTNKTVGSISQTGEAFFISTAHLKAWDRGWQGRLSKLFQSGNNGVAWACSLSSACWDKSVGKDRVSTVFDALKGTRKTHSKALQRTWDCCKGCCLSGTLVSDIEGVRDLDYPDVEWPECTYE